MRGATLRSSVSPRRARLGGSTIFHMSAWMWCKKTMRGPDAQSGEKNGMPFQISTSASRRP
jgi:hypothetical protein